MDTFTLTCPFTPQGDQPQAIAKLAKGLDDGLAHQVLLGVTGSGKTFSIANVIAQVQRPALIMAPNKILAAQLYGEFKELFPQNAVEYFVSYYDYYQPEAYVPTTDTYIEKEATINDEIDKLRHAATRSLLTRRDVIIVASVSCIYGIGSPETYGGMCVALAEGEPIGRDQLIERLISMQYDRNDYDFHRGVFRVRGDIVDIFPAHEATTAIRVEFFGDDIEGVYEIDPLRGQTNRRLRRIVIYPSTHYATTRDALQNATKSIKAELAERLEELRQEDKLLEAQRLEQRTMFDLEMINETGYCSGIENYSRHLDGRLPGEPPFSLLDYFPDDFITIIDESHITVSQVSAMYKGDRARKDKLVDYGFRLPSARDNRPLKFEEFMTRVGQIIHVSATPGPFELDHGGDAIAEQVVRPTGLVDPEVEVRPAANQVDDLLGEIRKTAAKGWRVLVTTLTKRMAEDLTTYFDDLGVRVRYMHADVETLDRIELVRQLRQGEYDVLVGINLLREGLDLPEVALVAILDADKEGYLRSERSLIQTCGRAARNILGRVIMYADKETDSMRRAFSEMNRRRVKQLEYNKAHKITPRSIEKSIASILDTVFEKDYVTVPKVAEEAARYISHGALDKQIRDLKKRMKDAADKMEFEAAAKYRDKLLALERQQIEQGL